MRGEYLFQRRGAYDPAELPPRARRIRRPATILSNNNGTTSACAENTRRALAYALNHRNYLRVRGEYPCYRPWRLKDEELPPRARRIRWQSVALMQKLGTTSACAENTDAQSPDAAGFGNYLRVRGEYHD